MKMPEYLRVKIVPSTFQIIVEAVKEELVPVANATPCDFCAYNPPSSCDGKPCTICPAHGKPR